MLTTTTSKTQTLDLTAPEKLNEEHDFSDFDCGIQSINEYAKRAHKEQGNNNAIIFVSCMRGTKKVRAFYTLTSGSVFRSELPRNMQRNTPSQYPVTILGRLGVDKSHQGNGVGLDLLADAIARAKSASETVASRAILVHALDHGLLDFYKGKAGFVASSISPLTLLLPLF